METRNDIKEIRAYRLANKLCRDCGKPAMPDLKMCPACAEKNKNRSKERYKKYGIKYAQERREQRKCLQGCGRDARANSVRCQECGDRAAELAKAKKHERKKQGLCPDCGKRPPREGYNKCEVCQKYIVHKYHKMKDKVFAAYGGYKCACSKCPETNPEFMTIDHINRDGQEHRKTIGQRNLYRWLKKNNYPKGYQVLCWNCNLGRRFGKECPHVRKVPPFVDVLDCPSHIHVYQDLANNTNKTIPELLKTYKFVFFPHEWKYRSKQILAHCSSYNEVARTFMARKCEVKEIPLEQLKEFCQEYHIQGKAHLAFIGAGIFCEGELLGVMSLGRHHRQRQGCKVLDRLCFKDNIRVIGGASKLLSFLVSKAKEQGITTIISWSDNRMAIGKVYEQLGFSLEKELKPDYFWVKKDDFMSHKSKQSQRKCNTGCPPEITERKWAEMNELIRVYDAGKKSWLMNI